MSDKKDWIMEVIQKYSKKSKKPLYFLPANAYKEFYDEDRAIAQSHALNYGCIIVDEEDAPVSTDVIDEILRHN